MTVGSDILTCLQISTVRCSVPVVPISVVLPVIVAIALLVGLPAAVFVLWLIPAGEARRAEQTNGDCKRSCCLS